MKSNQIPEPVAIVGSACRFPGGASSPAALWELLKSPTDLSSEIPADRFDTATFYHPDGSHHGTTNVRHAYLLKEDVCLFDAAFFNISPNEADSIDPQQRLLLETVYEALEAGGHTLEALKGSDTAVYAGTMTADYNDTVTRDHNSMPTYFATGTSRAIISNRVSYFFDWHGPSMTIDTACSSSLIAVHQSIKALRTGESRVAVATGTQVILNPEMFIGESKLKMLSPTGKSRMWDADADGYARGEGVAVVVLKLLSDAIADGDHIECIVRETGANQDGFSNGLTVPNTDAQVALIHQTYARAGLDPDNNPDDRPQFFEAHGTGTQTGDSRESAAIYETFGKHVKAGTEPPLYVGSVKTLIGHLEGAAGLAGLLKGAALVQNGLVTPNLHFNRLNPRVEPFYNGVCVPTQVMPWPDLAQGVPRRVSVNSFGFGGANAHAILEQFQQEPSALPSSSSAAHEGPCVSPFVFSALSEAALVSQLQAYSVHLHEHHATINAADLAWTLRSRRSHFPYKTTFAASNIEQLASMIDAKLIELSTKPGAAVGIRSNTKTSTPCLLGVFTGQGAQWPAMGAALIRASAFVRKRVEALEEALDTLPPAHRPAWSLVEEMLAGDETSRIAEAALSQPLCLAVQVVMVDLLRAAGITFAAVVGHSSGEIGAAYAAGFLSDMDSIRVAYYRGLYAGIPAHGSAVKKGAMLAVGTSWEDAQELVNLRRFRGRLAVAAHNSSASVTLSGDHDAILHAKKVFDEEKIFARILKVDMAYHSHHMIASGDPYVRALRDCGVKVNKDRPANAPAWFSSVTGSPEPLEPSEDIQDIYWRDNMCNTVLFCHAVSNAVASFADLNLAVEVGPHPALKGPATQNMTEVRPAQIPYTGVLSRGKDDVEAFADALGFMWANLPKLVDFRAYEKVMIGAHSRIPRLVIGLPKYQWQHNRTYWAESRVSRKMRHRKSGGPHEILGYLSPNSNLHDLHWSNVLKPSEVSWLAGHQLQGQMVFPAAGYVGMAFEAAKHLAAEKQNSVELFELHNLLIPRAIIFEEGDTNGVETLVALTSAQHYQDYTTAEFACYSTPLLGAGSDQEMDLMASGTIRIVFGRPNAAALSSTPTEDYNMTSHDVDYFYSTLADLGYNYRGPFRTLSSLRRKLNSSAALLDTYFQDDIDKQSEYLVHPSTLDVAFQSAFLAYSAPGDGRLWSLQVPTRIACIRVNPHVSASAGAQLPVCAELDAESESLSANIDMFEPEGQHAMVQIEDLGMKPFAPATKDDDRVMFTNVELGMYLPDGATVVKNACPSPLEIELANVCERVAYYFFRKWKTELSEAEWTSNELHPHWVHYLSWIDEVLTMASRGQHPTIRKAWAQDSGEEIHALISKYSGDSIDMRLLHAMGDHLPAAVRGETASIEHLLLPATIQSWYENALGFSQYHSFLAQMVKQVTFRYPHSRILEIGAGGGGVTANVLEHLDNKFSSYTYTDVSDEHFPQAAANFAAYSHKMTFKKFDAEKTPTSQGYEPHSYDIIIASNLLILDAAEFVQTLLDNARKLLRPGGYLILMGITSQAPVRYHSILGSISGWRPGVNDGRRLSPPMTPSMWHNALRKTGFGGVDAITPEISGAVWPMSVIASQAVDDRVKILQRPLSASSSGSRIEIESLVILGNQSLKTSQFSEELTDHLRRFCGEIIVLGGLPTEDEASSLNPSSTFINLVDLDVPIFKDVTDATMDGLKRMLELAKSVTWVTQGAQLEEPYHMASIAFLRSLRMEEIHLSLNHIDLCGSQQQNSGQSKAIAEYVLRQVALDEWDAPPSALATPIHRQCGFLWSKETEVYLDPSGKLQLPRVVVNGDQDDRINSSRRAITKLLRVGQSNVSVVKPSYDTPPVLMEQMAGRQARQGLPDSHSPVRLHSSSLAALRVATDTFLFLGIGTGKTDNRLRAILSSTNSSEVQPLASVQIPLSAETEMDTDSLLVGIMTEVLARSLVSSLSTGSHMLVHASGHDHALASALERVGAAKSIRFTFSCDSHDDQQNEATRSWFKINARAPSYALRKRLGQVQPTNFIDITLGGPSRELGARISQSLPQDCVKVDASALFRHRSPPPPPMDRLGDLGLEDLLQDVVSSAKPIKSDSVTSIEKLRGLSQTSALSGIHWPLDGQVEVVVRKMDARLLFSKDKTYLLVGLSGQLGQALAQWMVSNGAGCVVLTSRRPNIDKRWLASFQGSGVGTVKVMALDVLDISRVQDVVKDIRATCPPIGGVINGAMVLEDVLFSNMSGEAMRRVLAPKIDGTRNLDEVFYHDDLDFFIPLSSATCLGGNAGQTNYAAGNGYLHGLVRQRRRRGLAGSVLDIGRVSGIGYIETAGAVVREQLEKYKMVHISEVDLCQSIAETIQVGYALFDEDQAGIPAVSVTTGVRKYADDEDVKGPWFVAPIFAQIITESTSAEDGMEAGGDSGNRALPVGQRLPKASNKEEGLAILREAFAATLRTMLQLGDQVIDQDAPLMELGIDSLVAVEVRSWFLKAVKVDVPVLKIIGGASLVEICERAFEKLPKELEPSSASNSDGASGAEPLSSEKSSSKLSSSSPAKITSARRATQGNQPQPQPQPDDTSASKPESSSTSDDGSILETAATTPIIPSKNEGFEKLSDSAILALGGRGPKSTSATSRSPTEDGVLSRSVPRPTRFLKSERISLPQSRFWFLRHLLEDQTTPNVTFSYHMAGPLRVADLEKAIRIVTNRHEALRTCFVAHETEAGQAYQKVLSSSPLRLEKKTVASKDDVSAEYRLLKRHVFDLASGDTMRLMLLQLSSSEQDHYLLINYHHIVMDGASFQVFLADLEKAYNGQSLGPPPRQYPDFAAAQRKALDAGEMRDELKYWQGIFPDGEQPPVLPLLPMARTTCRVSMSAFDSIEAAQWLDPAVLERVRVLSKSQRSTPFHLYLAAFKTMLFCLAGSDTQDLTIGIADAARNESDIKGSIGFFLNLLTLRFRRNPDQTFAEAVSEARDITYAALGSSRLPFDVLLSELKVERSSMHSPFFQAFFDYRQGTQEVQPWGNVKMAYHHVHPGRTAYDVTLDIIDNPDAVYLAIRVQRSLYDQSSANLLLETFAHFLDVMTMDGSLALKDAPIFGDAQLSKGITIGRSPEMVSDWPETLPHRIDEVAQVNGSQVALVDGASSPRSLTYSEMIDRVEAVAEGLKSVGVGSGARVLVFQQPTVDWACSMLAILRIGAVYIPLDLRNPLARLAAIARDCEADAVLAHAATVDDAQKLQIDRIINVSVLPGKPTAPVAISARSEAPAAILYTSGSTGTPKGIIVTHAGLRNEIEGYTKSQGLAAERVLQQSAMTFNHASDQMYTGLVNGGMVYVVPADKRGDPLEITKIIHEQAITYTKATPAEYLLWLQYGPENLRQASSWRFAYGGGEQLTTVVTDGFASLHLPQLRMFNSYGPTEVSISSHKMNMPYSDRSAMLDMGSAIPCGYSLPNYHTYILDEQLRPMPIGMPGEIYIGGAGVSLGYLNNQELTERHFVRNPFATTIDIAKGWTKMYRTGDIGYLRQDGAMIFKGRLAGDTQVKIRGIRIELSDIENTIMAAANGTLRGVVVTLRENDLLIAHVVFAQQQDDLKDRQRFLDRLLSQLALPQYMIPVVAVPLDQFPMNNHAKVDRKAVQSMPIPVRAKLHDTEVRDMTETMVQLKLVWRQILGENMDKVFAVTPTSNFFLVGGNSLLVIRLQAQIRATFNIIVPLVNLLSSTTLGEMAQLIEESSNTGHKAEIDWALETTPPVVPDFLYGAHGNVNDHEAEKNDARKTYLVTGGTSFTAKYLLEKLAARSDTQVIHCVALREKSRDSTPFTSPKVVYHLGNLSAPLLGLTPNAFGNLAAQVDVILHLGAVRGYFDNYHLLRSSNVYPTRELVKLAAPRRVPIHYISTAGVFPRDLVASNGIAGTAAEYVPATDGNDGYAASKWVSERILERSATELGVPSSIYRFFPSGGGGDDDASQISPGKEEAEASEQRLLTELGELVNVSGMMPDMDGWTGRVDFGPGEHVAAWLLEGIVGGERAAAPYPTATAAICTFVHYKSPISVDASKVRAAIEGRNSADGGRLEQMPVLKWFGRIKAFGFGYLLTGHDTAVDATGNGRSMLVVRR
ncbi:putative Hybrid PKS-NRPS biosynthetic cluster [Gnomoniopsis sp. IMI 355080]|nr:putative Hybrid PKS-NRPS biosynthetic cluster [Gnomoniopsis sp. IMI 355080]